MYCYEKKLPEGFHVEKEIVEGSSAKVFILINNEDKRIVRKISDIEGINNNGRDKLRKEINFLEYFYNTRSENVYPKIYNYESNDSYVYYDMCFVEGKTLQQLISENKKDEIIDCCNKVLNDLCVYSNIQRNNTNDENMLLYKFYIDKTKNVVNKLLKNDKIEDIVQLDTITINNKVYKNVKTIINYFYEDDIQNRLKSNEVCFCFHGDLISSNIIYNDGYVRYIDPRGDFNKFDICYDIAKMKFSFSGYDQVNNDKFILYDSKESINFQLENNFYSFLDNYFSTLLRKHEMFSNSIIKQDGYWQERIELHTALQYINNSYIQIERGNMDKFKVMYGIGIVKLNELLNKLY